MASPTSDNIDTVTARELTSRALSVPVQSISLAPIGTGRFSTSWYVTVQDDDPACRQTDLPGQYVLRVAPPDDAGFLFYEYRMMRQEPALHRMIRRCTQVPAPRIVAYDFSRRHIDRDWLIMDRLPGEPLTAARSPLSAEDVETVLAALGRHVAQLHTITGRTFGYRGRHHPMSPQKTWPDAFGIMWKKLLDDVRATGLYSQDLYDLAISLYPRHRRAFEGPFAPCLCHMDLWSENVLVDNGRLTGLIDFDRACWAEPGIELAIAEYCGLTRPGFWAGYGHKPHLSETFLVPPLVLPPVRAPEVHRDQRPSPSQPASRPRLRRRLRRDDSSLRGLRRPRRLAGQLLTTISEPRA